jgi:hypothetical protein
MPSVEARPPTEAEGGWWPRQTYCISLAERGLVHFLFELARTEKQREPEILGTAQARRIFRSDLAGKYSPQMQSVR